MDVFQSMDGRFSDHDLAKILLPGRQGVGDARASTRFTNRHRVRRESEVNDFPATVKARQARALLRTEARRDEIRQEFDRFLSEGSVDASFAGAMIQKDDVTGPAHDHAARLRPAPSAARQGGREGPVCAMPQAESSAVPVGSSVQLPPTLPLSGSSAQLPAPALFRPTKIFLGLDGAPTLDDEPAGQAGTGQRGEPPPAPPPVHVEAKSWRHPRVGSAPPVSMDLAACMGPFPPQSIEKWDCMDALEDEQRNRIGKSVIVDRTGAKAYLELCAKLKVPPQRAFLKQAGSTRLVMRHVPLGVKGGLALCGALADNCSLQEINLYRCGIGAESLRSASKPSQSPSPQTPPFTPIHPPTGCFPSVQHLAPRPLRQPTNTPTGFPPRPHTSPPRPRTSTTPTHLCAKWRRRIGAVGVEVEGEVEEGGKRLK